MKFDLQKNLSGHSLALVAILVASILGLIVKPNEKHIPPYKWALLITGTMSATGLLGVFIEDSVNQILKDEKPDSHIADSEDDRGSRSGDVHMHTHAVLPASFDEKLEIVAKDVAEIAQRMGALDLALAKQLSAIKPKELTVKEKEQQARYALIARLSNLGTDSSPVDALQGAIQICSDARLWEHPARTPTIHIDTQRFYNEGKIWPTIRDNHIVWSLDPDYDPWILIMILQMKQMKLSKRLSAPFVAVPGANILASITTAARSCPSAVARATHLSNAGNLRVRTMVLQFQS